jgi:hypothetical protein
MKRYAFISSEDTVVQVIVGALNAAQAERLLADYRILFGAESLVEIMDAETPVWIGGSYTDGVFAPPPEPEPLPEPLPEPEPEPEV